MKVKLLKQNRIDGKAGDIVEVTPARAAFLLKMRHACADGSVSRNRGRRRGVRVNTEIDITHCTKLRLEHNVFALRIRLR